MHILKASSLAARGARAAALLVALVSLHAVARGVLPAPDYVAFEPRADHFPLVQGGVAAPLFVSEEDFAGVHTVAGHLQADIARVTGVEPVLSTEGAPVGGRAVLIGTLGRSPVLEKLVQDGKLDVRAVEGRWETFGLQVVEAPLPEVDEALVIFGSDKRGTIFGMYDLSAAIGVSPWSWWADTPVAPQDALFVAPGRHTRGEPKVKYRGIFINDEAPALTTWAEETFGGFNADFYARVFELLLRLRGNYLWPAMWQPAAFYEDDPENARLADELGVVIATSHHEPMMRAHDEWSRKDRGEWNYETNAAALREFWRGGIERMGGNESVVTVGMRGDGDHAMTEGTAIDLLEQIIADQREIIAEVTGRPPEETPQVWALYKEVQDYYDAGMRVPDDVMILLCDDNWGNIRVLPSAEERDHPGGFGLYYHFDFVGGPISYRWLNVTQIERVWEQMRLTYAWGVDELWLVNVGDIKPMELPTSFFLDLAWDPEAIGAVDLPAYYTAWAAQQFGPGHAVEIGEILALATKYAGRRTPEMLTSETYSLLHYDEAERNLAEHRALVERVRVVEAQLPVEAHPAFFQLVRFPVEAVANVHELHAAAGRNQLYATQGRASANRHAGAAERFFARDAELTRAYHTLLDGKWNHMMSQTHLGYTFWNHPPVNKMPAVTRVQPREEPELGFFLEGGDSPGVSTQGVGRFETRLPVFDPVNDQRHFIEVFNYSTSPLIYRLEAQDHWIRLSTTGGSLADEEARIAVHVDWASAPATATTGTVLLQGPQREHVIEVPIRPELPAVAGHVEDNGVVAIEADAFTRAVAGTEADWLVVPNLGRVGSAVTTQPFLVEPQEPGAGAPMLEYTFTVFQPGEVTLEMHLSPTLNFQKDEGLRFAVAMNDEAPTVVNLHEGETVPDWQYPLWWNTSVTDRIKVKTTTHQLTAAGPHTLRVWMIDPGVVFQKFVLDAGGLQPSYLGPPPSRRVD